jgi:lipoprotein signal peptidase
VKKTRLCVRALLCTFTSTGICFNVIAYAYHKKLCTTRFALLALIYFSQVSNLNDNYFYKIIIHFTSAYEYLIITINTHAK